MSCTRYMPRCKVVLFRRKGAVWLDALPEATCESWMPVGIDQRLPWRMSNALSNKQCVRRVVFVSHSMRCSGLLCVVLLQVIMALGGLWHPEHFMCVHCKEPLGTQNFFERDNQPYCERDYYLLFSPRCASCNGPILDVGNSMVIHSTVTFVYTPCLWVDHCYFTRTSAEVDHFS